MDRMSTKDVKEELQRLLERIDDQIKVVDKYAYSQGLEPSQVRSEDGTYLMTNLVLAKAQVLTTLAQLRPSIINHITPKGR